jgi:hypothetical protein
MAATKGHGLRRVVIRLVTLLTLSASVLMVGPVGRAAAAHKTPPGDPPGNNGTIKVDRDGPADQDMGNEPIGDGCIIWLDFYNFDQGQTADITFTAQPPSGKGETLIADKAVPISNDAAGGGQDRDAVIGYNLTTAVQGLKAQPQHGYHIKVSSDSLQAPGGAKHKVFWINCAPAPATTLRISKAVQGSGAGPFGFTVRCNHRPLDTVFTLQAGEKHDVTNVPPGTTCVATETDAKGAQSTSVAENPPSGAADGTVKVAAGTPETITFTNVFPGTGGKPAPSDSDLRGANGAPSTANGGTSGATSGGNGGTAAGTAGSPGTPAPANPSVLGETVSRPASAPGTPATLPRTGEDASALALLGVWALSAGALARAAGRSRPGRQS